MRKAIIGAIVAVSTFAPIPFAAAQDAKTAPAPAPKMDMMRGMSDHMGDMEKNMGGMHQMMQGCVTDEKNCPMDKMMTDMKAMHAQMNKMMADMKSMHKPGEPMAKEKAVPNDKPEDHEKHHN